MAVRIPIVTVFDSKGLKQAQYQLNKVRGNFQNLGRNFAIAGAALAGGVALIGKSLKDAAESQRVFAQTEAVLKSTGTTANGTARDIQNLASSLQKSTAFNDEAILAGQNLLLTFKGVRNEAGKGNDIFNQASATMLDFARATNTDASSAAIKLGKALQDPTRGVTALRKSGVDFTKDQMEMIKSLQDSGDLMGAQKIVLAELQAQFGGSAAAYAQTFSGQVESLNNELNDLSEEIGFMVMPAVRDMVAAFRELAPEIGTNLKSALASVDWKAFSKAIVDLITFLAQNAETILKVVGAIYALNTAYNLGKVAVGLYNAATIILNTTLKTTTTSAKLLRGALLLTGVAAAVMHVGDTYNKTKGLIEKTTPALSEFNKETISVTKAAAELSPITKLYHQLTFAIIGAAAAKQRLASTPSTSKAGRTSVMDDYNYNLLTGQKTPDLPVIDDLLPDLDKAVGGAKDPTGLKAWTATAKQEGKISKKETKLIAKGLGADVAASLAGSGLATVNDALKRVTKNGSKAIKNLTKQYQGSAAGQAAAAAAASAAAEASAQAVAAAAATEAAAVAEKKRVYESFANSITSTFSNIKESILSAFSLPELGGSTDSIIRNMDKLLARVKSFSANITKLSSMGLDPKLLQQVINAGPIAGAKLAANLVSGGVGGLTAINKGYSELGNLAGEIGMTGTQAQFGTTQQQQIINVNISGGLDSSASIGKAVVDAVRAYERTSGAVWQGA
jgi:hypothetical protein